MKVQIKKIRQRLRGMNNRRGMALVTTFMVIMVLTVLGLGIVALVMANAQQTKYADTAERLYYSAEGGAQQAAATLRRAIVNVYNDLAVDRDSSLSTYNTNFANFFTESSTNYSLIRRAFGAVVSGKYTFTPVGLIYPTSAVITMSAGPDSSSRLFTIVSTASSGAAQRSASCTMVVHKIDVVYLPTQSKINPNLFNFIFGDYGVAALLLGGTLDFSGLPNQNYVNLYSTNEPVASLGRLIPDNPSQLLYDSDINSWTYDALEIDSKNSNTTRTLDSLNWYIEYSMLYNDGDDSTETAFKNAYNIADTYPGSVNPSAKHSLLSPTGTPMKVPADNIVTPAGLFTKTYDPITGALVVDASGQPVLTPVAGVTIKPTDYVNGTSTAARKLYLMGDARPHAASKVSYTMQDFSYNYDKITEAYIYCDGDLTMQRCLLQKAFIHVTGDLYITNSELVGSTVYCDGNIIITNDSSSNTYNAWRTIVQAFWAWITSSGTNYLKDNPNLIYSKYDTTFNGNSLNGYYYVGRDLYANSGDMSVRPASIIYVTRNTYLAPTGGTYKYRGLIYCFGNISAEGSVSIAGQAAARGNLTIARVNSAMAKLTIDYGYGNALVSELENLFGSSSRFNSSNFNTAVYITASDSQVVIPKTSDMITNDNGVKPN